MDIAITSDVHLSKNHPERIKNLKDILTNLVHMKIQDIIIAGDLFDKGYTGNNDFDKLASNYKNLTIHIIPGNHDTDIKQAQFHSENIKIYSAPTIKNIDKREFLFLPYIHGKSMAEVIDNSKLLENLKEKEWILISHGNYGSYNQQESGNETGYFPISDKTIQKYSPYRVILGHIHKPLDKTPVYYPGSPYPMDKNEIGQRRFLIFNTVDGSITSNYLDNTPIYSHWDFFVIPTGNELMQIKEQAKTYFEREKSIYHGKSFLQNLILYIDIKGFTKSLTNFKNDIERMMNNDFSLKNIFVNIDNLMQSDNEALTDIAKKTHETIMNMEIIYSDEIKKQAISEAFKIIYSTK